jgi:2-oxoglutarate dehydrogenase E2 component (dihydrolipoamide succinyltransferase)
MKHEVIVPSAGESINEVYIGVWRKKSGDIVKKDDVLVDIETQKATFELQAEQSGKIEVLKPTPETVVKPGDVIAIIDDSFKDSTATAAFVPAPTSLMTAPKASTESVVSSSAVGAGSGPAARKIAAENQINLSSLQGKGSGKTGRITKEDLLLAMETAPRSSSSAAPAVSSQPPVFNYSIDAARGERRQPASRIRRTIAQNLVTAQHTAAILTTFNEVDMSQVIAFRKKYKEKFQEKYGVSLGMVSLFARATVRALKEYPMVNSSYTGEDIISRDFVDLSVAVSADSGLVVPVIRNADKMSLVDFEKKLGELSDKAKGRKLSIEEMTGGTFTISNGGVFGSLLSTPILNMPQSGILGLHKIQERPMAINGEVVIRPMMYLALSYDHRIIDGREAVKFLVSVKEGIEKLDLIVNEKEI